MVVSNGLDLKVVLIAWEDSMTGVLYARWIEIIIFASLGGLKDIFLSILIL